MTREDINDIINAICPNDEDYEKPCISPKYLRQELEQLALDQRRWNEEPTTKNNLGVDREDAVERLNALKQLIGYDKDSEIVKATQKSLDMAIKALEQEPTTKNNLGVDLISRTAVLKLIYDYKENHSENRNEYPINYGTLLDMIRWVRDLPSVTPQEPTIKALGEELRKARKGIADEKVLIGYNMAIAICNKHLGESEERNEIG